MNFHTSVLLKEAIDGLKVQKGQKYIDATIGGGGHTKAILERGGLVLGIDQDPESIEFVKANLKSQISNLKLILHRGNFRQIEKIAKENGFEKTSGILLDLGVSSYQVDTGNRGFSYQRQGPLDMRMDPDKKIKASDLVNLLERKKLYEIFKNLGEERNAGVISSAIVRSRRVKAIMTTEDLVKVIAQALGIKGELTNKMRTNIAKRVFQALRMEVNAELNSLKEVLDSCPSLLQSSGRLLVISFHSLEDRIVKDSFIDFERKGLGTIITPKPILPSASEVLVNSRSKGAKLRIFKKI
ncbi:MAG: 16S rRNA (cytosine(1402)-N(4))-methyltransferase RsmH [Patescibacteria group bacterium]